MRHFLLRLGLRLLGVRVRFGTVRVAGISVTLTEIEKWGVDYALQRAALRVWDCKRGENP